MSQLNFNFSFEVLGQEDNQELFFGVTEFIFEETVSAPYRLEVNLISPDPSISFDQVLDKKARFIIFESKHPVRYVYGVISDFSFASSSKDFTHYKAIVEPDIVRAALSSNWKIFQQKTVQTIVDEVIKSIGIANYHQFAHIQNSHPQREYCVQAGDTNFTFIQRLLAQEGFVYRFEHDKSAYQHIITDSIFAFGAINASSEDNDSKDNTSSQEKQNQPIQVLYNPPSGMNQPVLALDNLNYHEKVLSTKLTQRDYTFKNPRYKQEHTHVGSNVATQEISSQARNYEYFDYPGHYKQDDPAKVFTEAKMQSIVAQAQTANVSGNDYRIQAGLAFELQGHPRDQMNRMWRAITVVHTGFQEQFSYNGEIVSNSASSYHLEASLVAADFNWKSPVPVQQKMLGTQVATVTGPKNEEIYTDEYGRVKVEFPWDRASKGDETSSCWIRVSQDWAGAGWGHMALPRVGQEVIVDFLDGDQDQPIIIGRAYNAIHPTPYKLPALKTQQTTKSKEHKGSGYNELLMDDTTGELKTKLHTTHGATQLTMGYLTHPRKDDGNGEHRGDGFELRTDQWGAIRAGNGLYISTDIREKAQGQQLDIQEAIAQLEQALNIAKDLANASQTAGTIASDTQTQTYQLNDVYKQLQQSGILASSPQGIATVTPSSAQISAGKNITLTAAQNTDINTLKDYRVAAGKAVSILSVDKEMNLISNKGKLQLQAQNNAMSINAKDDLEVTSSKGKITVAAKDELMLTCGGAYIKLTAGKIEIGGGGLDLLVGNMMTTGSSQFNYDLPNFNKAFVQESVNEPYNLTFLLTDDEHVPYANNPYIAFFEDGSTKKGYTNKDGYTETFISNKREEVSIHLLDKESVARNEAIKKNNLRFHFINDSGSPYANTEYTATRADGSIESGITDSEGFTNYFYSDEPEEISVHLHI